MDAERRHTTTSAETAPDRRVLLLFVLVALVPVVGAAVRLHHAGWIPEGDDAMIARRTMAVFSHDPPVSGQPSTAGNLFTHDGRGGHAASVEASHPGPLEYYLLAIPYRLSGWSPGGLLAAVVLVNGAAAATAVWLSWRRLGTIGAATAALAVLLVAAHLGTWNLARPLNANIAVLALLAGLVATWGVLDRDRAALVPAVVALSFVIQAHLGAAPVAAAALVVAVGTAVWNGWRDQRSHLVAAAATLAAVWALVVVQQFTGHPGNLAALVDVTRLPIDRAGPAFGLSAVFDQVTQPAWPGVPALPRISILGPIPVGVALAKGALVLVLLAAAAWWSRRARRPTLVRLVAVAAGAVVVPALVLSRGPDEVRLGPSYQLTSLLAVGALVTMSLLAVLADVVGPLRIPRAAAVAGAAGLGLVAIAVATWGGPTYPADAARTRAIAAAIRAQVPKGTYKLSAEGTWAYLSTLDAVSVELLRHGYDIRVVRLGTTPDEGIRRDTKITAPTIVVDSTDVARTDGRLLVRRGPLPSDPTWAGPLLAAVSQPDVHLEVMASGDRTRSRCVDDVVRVARGPDTASRRRHVVRAVLRCPQGDRRTIGRSLRWNGLDAFWVDLLGSNMPGPFPHTGLAAYLVPAPTRDQPGE